MARSRCLPTFVADCTWTSTGAQLEMTERADGVIELRAALPVPADQRWFWAERWQQREREVDEDVAAGRVAIHGSTEDFLGHLAELEIE